MAFVGCFVHMDNTALCVNPDMRLFLFNKVIAQKKKKRAAVPVWSDFIGSFRANDFPGANNDFG